MFLAGFKGMSFYGQLMAKGQGPSLSIFPWEGSRAPLVGEFVLWASVFLPVSKWDDVGDPWEAPYPTDSWIHRER